MIIQRVDLKLLRASGQPRPLITADVDRLAASINEIGLIQPITVRRSTVVNGIAEEGYQIVAGHHRVAAVRTLGWAEVDAVVIDAAEHLQAELIEIDENLCRSELSPAQRASSVKRRKQVWEALHPDDKLTQVGPVSKGGRGNTGFASETAEVSGESKTAVNRHIARAEALGEDIDEVVGTSLDKGVELDALKKMPEPERKELIERAKAGEQVSARNVHHQDIQEALHKQKAKRQSGSAQDADAIINRLECTAQLIKRFQSVDHAVDWAADLKFSADARAALRFFADLDGAMVTE